MNGETPQRVIRSAKGAPKVITRAARSVFDLPPLPGDETRRMTGFPGVPARVLIFLAANPGAELLVADLIERFGMHPRKSACLAQAIRDGWLVVAKRENGRARMLNVYRAGPRLQHAAGEAA